MRMRNLISLVLCLAAAALSGCGGGGGGGAAADPNAPAAVRLTVSKAVALADGSDAVTVQADIKKADGSAAADGTPVTFSVPDNSGTLSASSKTTTSGLASVTITRAPISGANNQAVTVTGTAGSVSGTAGVKFINQPTSVDVSIAFDQAVTDLAALSFKLNSTTGVTFDNAAQPISALNSATGSLVVGNFSTAANSNTIGLVNANGFNTGTATIVKATYAIGAGSSLPAFSIDPTPASLSATSTTGGATTPAVTAADMVVTVTFNTEL